MHWSIHPLSCYICINRKLGGRGGGGPDLKIRSSQEWYIFPKLLARMLDLLHTVAANILHT